RALAMAHRDRTLANRLREQDRRSGQAERAHDRYPNDSYHEEQRGDAWEPPIPLTETPTADCFPVDVFPVPLRAFVREAAAALACPADYIAVPLLTLAGAAIGAARELEIK